MRFLAILLALAAPGVHAQSPQVADRVGDVYEVRLESVSATSGEDSSGSSRSADTLIERVIAVRDNSVELEFDLPEQSSAEDRARAWQFPVRVLKSPGHPLQLLNAPELEVRIDTWLRSGGLTRAACGQWFFTWTAVKIECDPQSVLQILEPFDLRPDDLRKGAMHREAGALEPTPLRMEPASSGGAIFTANMKIDPDAVRRERAEADVVVAQIMREAPLTLEAALQERATERISGSILSTFETDAAGRVTRRKQVADIETSDGTGSPERQNTTVTVERRLLPRF